MTIQGPAPKPAKSRLRQDGRDMFWSLAPLVLACIVLAGLVGMCSFQPAGPTSGPSPSYDAAKALHADAKDLGFPIRLPQLPGDWHSNSGQRGNVGTSLTSRVGYLAPSGMYVSVTQSNADEQQLVSSINSNLVPTGVQNIAGAAGPATSGTVVTWVVYEGAGQPVWTTRLDGPTGAAQIAITGAAKPDEFRTLAAATQSQAPLPA